VLGVPILSPGAVVLIAKPSCEMLRVASFFFAGSHVLAPLSLLVVCVGSQSNRKGPPRQEEDLYLVPYVVVRFVWSATRDSNPAWNAFEASVSSAGLVAVIARTHPRDSDGSASGCSQPYRYGTSERVATSRTSRPIPASPCGKTRYRSWRGY